ncbi:MAG: hypothetical protein AAFR46_05380 [Pseudomonadota bacterium]
MAGSADAPERAGWDAPEDLAKRLAGAGLIDHELCAAEAAEPADPQRGTGPDSAKEDAPESAREGVPESPASALAADQIQARDAALRAALGGSVEGPFFRLGLCRYGVRAGPDPAALAARLTAELRAAGCGGSWRLVRRAPPVDAAGHATDPDPAHALLGAAARHGQRIAQQSWGVSAQLVLDAGLALAAAEWTAAELTEAGLAGGCPKNAGAGAAGAHLKDPARDDALIAPAAPPPAASPADLEAALAPIAAQIAQIAAQAAPAPADSAPGASGAAAEGPDLQTAIARLERLRGAFQGQFRRLDAQCGALETAAGRFTDAGLLPADPLQPGRRGTGPKAVGRARAGAPTASALIGGPDGSAPGGVQPSDTPAWATALLSALSAREAAEAARSTQIANEIGNLRLILTGLRDRLRGLEAGLSQAPAPGAVLPAADIPARNAELAEGPTTGPTAGSTTGSTPGLTMDPDLASDRDLAPDQPAPGPMPQRGANLRGRPKTAPDAPQILAPVHGPPDPHMAVSGAGSGPVSGPGPGPRPSARDLTQPGDPNNVIPAIAGAARPAATGATPTLADPTLADPIPGGPNPPQAETERPAGAHEPAVQVQGGGVRSAPRPEAADPDGPNPRATDPSKTDPSETNPNETERGVASADRASADRASADRASANRADAVPPPRTARGGAAPFLSLLRAPMSGPARRR